MKARLNNLCHRGHELTPDNVYVCGKSKKCKTCAKLWRANNLEKCKAYQNEYRKLYPEVKAEYQRQYRKKNKVKLRAYSRSVNKLYSWGMMDNHQKINLSDH